MISKDGYECYLWLWLDLLMNGNTMHNSFHLTPGPESRRRIRTRPVLAHLFCVGCGVVGFVATQLYLLGETDDLGIFPADKRYLGAALCLVASVNAYWIMYQLAKLLVGISGLVSKSDVATLSPGITTYPDEWYLDVAIAEKSTVHSKGESTIEAE